MEAIYLRIGVILLLAIMGFQDFKYRGISWYFFPLLTVLLVCLNANYSSTSTIINLGFIVLVFVFLTLWFSIRTGRLVNLLNHYIGLGDLLFLACLSFYFSVEYFFLFYIVSLLLIAAGISILRLNVKKQNFTVPLAGLQSIILLMILVISLIPGVTVASLTILDRLI